MDTPEDEKKKTWYFMHKEQIKLIQWLLYHLQKSKRTTSETSSMKIEKGDFKVSFD
jgi:hypothetical protein